MVLWKVKIKLWTDTILNLFGKKKKPDPRFRSPLYMQRQIGLQKPKQNLVIAFLLAFVRECGMVAYGDLKWLVNIRKPEAADVAWNHAVERMRKGL
jgi:hypothetical protein